MNKINKQDFLDRCSTAYDAGYINSDSLLVLELTLEFCMRKISTDLHQKEIASEINTRLMRLSNGRELANFRELYEALQFGALLNHSCQKCATNKEKQHSRRCNGHNYNLDINF